ncbi:MAG: PaaI family thioesterase [Alphaproteobacteria bacterium]
MTNPIPQEPGWEARVRDSFARQPAMALVGATLGRVAPGEAEVLLPVRPEVGQQHGFVHGGVVAMIADSAAGYAAFSLAAPDATVLSVEYKINFLSPARGASLAARGRVAKAGRTLSIVEVDVVAIDPAGAETPCARMLQTVMNMRGRADAPRGGD